jgi:SAM-dependent methyltransferase
VTDWIDALWPFVRAHLPPKPAHVMEIGCGPEGGFVPALRDLGYDAVGVDPEAPAGPGYHRMPFEQYEPAGPVDAIVACTSLHHVDDLDTVLDRVAATLTGGGTLIVVEWARERFDEATARWCFERLPTTGEDGWLHRHRDQWRESGQPWSAYFDAWAAAERLHRGDAIVQALQDRFRTILLTDAPYFFAELEATTEDDERAAPIQATGIHYVATLS